MYQTRTQFVLRNGIELMLFTMCDCKYLHKILVLKYLREMVMCWVFIANLHNTIYAAYIVLKFEAEL